ncbi:MAG: hypothetical protein AMS16_01265 [Planctomycetes bacterium DG_58]|nr:MAG: hypothetical protein AMS16_01265 [Planctomycetes bacterium DG_58]
MKHLCMSLLVILLVTAGSTPARAAPDDETPKQKADRTPAETPKKEDKVEEPEKKPSGPVDADKLKQQLLATAAAGKLTDDLIDLFKTYALARAKQKLAKDVPADFWTWVEAKPTIREGLLVALHPEYSPHVVKSLEALREKFGEKVDTHPHLALAFAVVFGRAGDASPWAAALGYLRKDRKAPTMEQSFRYYLKYEKSMKFSLTQTPWPLLAYVADNETPLPERLWVLNTFRRAGKGVYYKVPYDWDLLKGNPDIGNRPRTLANIRKYGGVCVDRAYFASRVYKSLGVPSMSVSGAGRRGGHAWVAWVIPGEKSYELYDEGRFDMDRYYTGTTWDPLSRKNVLDRDVQLLSAALSTSYKRYLNACIGCHVYEMLEGDKRKGKTGLLKDSVEMNPFVARPWRLLADACVEGIATKEEGEKLFDSIFKALAPYPDLTFEVLAKVLSPRLQVEGEPDKEEIDSNSRVLNRAFQLYEKAKRPDLAVKLCLLQGSYFEAVDRKMSALKLYATASEKYAREHYGFREVFDRVLVMLSGQKNLKRRLAFCEVMIKEVPKQRSAFDKKLNQLNPSYVYVVRAYIRALYAAGKDSLAERWEKKIEPKDR